MAKKKDAKPNPGVQTTLTPQQRYEITQRSKDEAIRTLREIASSNHLDPAVRLQAATLLLAL